MFYRFYIENKCIYSSKYQNKRKCNRLCHSDHIYQGKKILVSCELKQMSLALSLCAAAALMALEP